MSDLFPNAVYVPTGVADEKDFIKVGGYCYKKAASNVIVSNETVREDIFGDYDNCLDCNTCACPKNIDFTIGGFLYDDVGNISFAEKKITIETSSTGWQEIAIESGYLNGNVSNHFFKPAQIRCYDRKIDMQTGIYVSFENRNAEIAHFKYVSGDDLYEREDMYFKSQEGDFGALPEWGYLNQYDRVGVANTIKTIKFKSLCEVPCNLHDVSFRIKGKVLENDSYVNLGQSYNDKVTSWVYASCTGIPKTPGLIVDCVPSGNGINFTDYFVGSFTGFAGWNGSEQVARPGVTGNVEYNVEFNPVSIDIVNMPMLEGEAGDGASKYYSVTGSGHFVEENWVYKHDYTTHYNQFNYGYDNNEEDFDFSKDIGQKYGIRYNRPSPGGSGCMDPAIHFGDFNTYYRHIGNNAIAMSATPGTNVGERYSGCYQTSEWADGIYKNGTYTPMMWTGTITGNNVDYKYFIDFSSTIATNPAYWETGVYIYQWYKSGDRSDASSIRGFFGYLTGEYTGVELQSHYRSTVLNSTPINIGNPMFEWDIKSGDFPILSATKKNYSVMLNFGQDNYSCFFETNVSGIMRNDFRDYERGSDPSTSPGLPDTVWDSYSVVVPFMENLDNPHNPTNTFIKKQPVNEGYLLTDSGNPYHAGDEVINKTLTQDKGTQFTDLESIRFQLSWDKNE